MTDHDRRFDAALKELALTDMWRSNYAPPLLRVMLKLGMKTRPPHYLPFWKVLFGYGIWFGIVWGVLMWFFTWRPEGFTVSAAIYASAFAGLLFGLFMAIIYAHGRRKWGLTPWQKL